MDKIAFVFAGQGAQYPGMGWDLYRETKTARKLFDAAEAIRPGTAKTCFEGTKEELSLTVNTQPCLYVTDYACAALAAEAGVKPDCCAGFSLGEVAAAAFCGMMSFEDGFRLVVRRAELMQKCAEENPGAMLAVLRLTGRQTNEICLGLDQAYAVNYNCPGQTVVACKAETVSALEAAVKSAGGRAVRLNVSGAFHSPFMAEAEKGLLDAMEGMTIRAPQIELYANLTGEPYRAGEEKETLAKQLCSPVRWQKTIERMLLDGVKTFVEVGAGSTLTGLIRKIDANAKTLNVGDLGTLAALKGAVPC